MDNIIDFNKAAPAEVIPTYDYSFRLKDGSEHTRHGVLTMNPMFYGVTDVDNHLIFSVAADQVLTVDRVAPRPAGNA